MKHHVIQVLWLDKSMRKIFFLLVIMMLISAFPRMENLARISSSHHDLIYVLSDTGGLLWWATEAPSKHLANWFPHITITRAPILNSRPFADQREVQLWTNPQPVASAHRYCQNHKTLFVAKEETYEDAHCLPEIWAFAGGFSANYISLIQNNVLQKISFVNYILLQV